MRVITPHQTMIDVLRDRAAAQPDAPAFTFLDAGEHEEAALTWGDIERRARAIAAAIQARIAPGARVLIMLAPGIDFVPAFFGVLYAGAIAIPVYPPAGAKVDRSIARLRGMTTDAGVSLVLSSAALHARAQSLNALIPELTGMPWLCVESVEESWGEGWRIPAISATSVALLQYTSGSTASPRGVMVSHANLLANLAEGAQLGDYDRHSVAVSWLPVNHDMGLINGVLQPVFSGYPAYLMSPAAFLQRPARWLQAISRYGGTHSGGQNFAYDLCTRRVSAEDAGALDLRSWRVAYNGSEPVRRDTLENFHRAFAPCGLRWSALRPAYGLAESTLLVSSGPGDGPGFLAGANGRSLVACGLADGRDGIRIVDPQSRVQLPDGAIGEIWLRNPSVASGYWNKPGETAATFGGFICNTGEGPFLRSGDLGVIVDRRLYVTGRIKDVLIVRGVKHYPQDLEATAEHAHAAVRPGCCAAFALERDGGEGVALVAEAEPRGGPADAALEEAIVAIRRSVAEQHQVAPCAIALVPAGTLPKTTSGKLQRFLCRDEFVRGAFPVLAAWRLEAAS